MRALRGGDGAPLCGSGDRCVAGKPHREGRCAIGYGDALIAQGLAQEMYAKDPSRGPILLIDENGVPRWRDEWRNDPAIRVQRSGPVLESTPTLRLGKGCLPYHPWNRQMRWRARDHRTRLYLDPMEIGLGMDVRARYGPFLLLEPPDLTRKNPNRRWPHWRALAEALPSLGWPVVQL